MARFSLRFNDVQMEEDYQATRRKLLFLCYIVITLSLQLLLLTCKQITALVGILSLLYFSILKTQHEGVTFLDILPNVIGIVLTVFALLLLKAFKKGFQLVSFLIFLCLFILMLINLKQTLQDADNSLVFFRGFNVIALQYFVQNSLLDFEYSLLFSVTSLAAKIIIFSIPQTLSPEEISLAVLSEAFFLVFHFTKIKKTRSLFSQLFHGREELTKFKDLVANHLPANIVVYAQNLQKEFFANQSFQRTFSEFRKDRLEISECLELFEVEKRGFGKRHDFSSKFICNIYKNDDWTLRNVLEKLIKFDCLKQGIITFHATLHGDKGKSKLFEVKLFSISWNGEESIVLMLEDITFRESIMSMRLADANKDKVISSISHEIKTPLNCMFGVLKIMEGQATDPQLLRYISICKNNLFLLLNILNSIIDLQLIRNNKLKLNPVTLKVRKLAEEIKSQFEFLCYQKSLSLTLEISKDVPKYIHSDYERLTQILVNLLVNAVKFTYKGEIKIGIQEDLHDPDQILFWVEDTGIGIQDDIKESLFKMYEIIEMKDTDNVHGIGLGLTISNHLAKLLNANVEDSGIKVESEPGKGSVFSFKIAKSVQCPIRKTSLNSSSNLDLQDEVCTKIQKYTSSFHENSLKNLDSGSYTQEEYSPRHMNQQQNEYLIRGSRKFSFKPSIDSMSKQLSSNSSYESRSPQFRRKPRVSIFKPRISTEPESQDYVLIVDDNPLNLMVAQHFIEEKKYRVKTALNGRDAIELVLEHLKGEQPFKIIFMDCQMPIMDGIEATRILKEKMANCEIPYMPIVALTANTTLKDKKKCLESGMDDFLGKPFKLQDLNRIFVRFTGN